MSKNILTVDNYPDSDEPSRKGGETPSEKTWPVVKAIEPDEDVLSRLSAEDEAAPPPVLPWLPARPKRSPGSAKPRSVVPILLAVAGLAVATAVAWYFYGPARSPAVLNGTLAIETGPAGAIVTIDGRVYGASPLTASLVPGRHAIELAGTTRRELSVTIEPGARVAQFVEMPEAPQPGRVHVETTPAGAQVTIDGTERGVTPLDIVDLDPGPHVVALRNGNATVTQNVTVQAGIPVSLLVPMGAAEAGMAGTVAVVSPVELQIFEGGRMLGTSRTDQIMMLAGRHDLRLVNRDAGYDVTRPVQVAPGRTSTVKVDIPNGALFVNALPWAEVFVDGSKIGETPIADYQLPLGSHEVVLRNPRFAEQRRTVIISLTAPVRVGVDLRK